VDARAERTDLRQAATGIAIAYRENILADEIDGILSVAEADLASGVAWKSDSPPGFRMARGRRIAGDRPSAAAISASEAPENTI
jgi:hypothetical protein